MQVYTYSLLTLPVHQNPGVGGNNPRYPDELKSCCPNYLFSSKTTADRFPGNYHNFLDFAILMAMTARNGSRNRSP